jgi:hypothetical protein
MGKVPILLDPGPPLRSPKEVLIEIWKEVPREVPIEIPERSFERGPD